MSGFNLADVYESLADAFPERPAVVSGATTLTFGELDRRANQLAHLWRAHGIGPGDHVGLYLYNGHAYLEAMLAAWKLRARTINVNHRYVSSELAYLAQDADLVGILHEPELAGEVDGAGLTGLRLRLSSAAYEGAIAGQPDHRDFPERSQDDLFLLYTGGTTGMPKGVMWRHEDLFFAALQGGQPGGEPFATPGEMAPALRSYGDGIHIHTAAPLIHGSSQLASWIALMNGGLAVLVPGRSYDAEASLRACAAHGVQTMNIVGDAMALPLVEVLQGLGGALDLSELQVISSAGAVLSAPVRQRLEELLPAAMVLDSFGSSETGHQGVALHEGGKAVWFMDDRHSVILDDALEPVVPGSGVVGRIARFGHIPLGYWKDEAKTAATFVEKGGRRYVVPGDMATVAEDGGIVFLGRGSVCINSGGEKVYVEEVEEALKHHPSVFDAVVVGVPDARWGERVEALVTLRTGCTPDEPAIVAFCRTRLAGYKAPRRIWVVDDLERQPSGKPDYRRARARAAALGAP